MRKLMAHCWGLNEADYIGRSMELFRDESVKWGGEEVGGIRIRAMSHIPDRKRISLQISKNKKMPIVVEPLRIEPKRDESQEKARAYADKLMASFASAESQQGLESLWNDALKPLDRLKQAYKVIYSDVEKAYLKRKGEIEPAFFPDPEDPDFVPERDDKTTDMFEQE
jgi:hypothetical protein